MPRCNTAFSQKWSAIQDQKIIDMMHANLEFREQRLLFGKYDPKTNVIQGLLIAKSFEDGSSIGGFKASIDCAELKNPDVEIFTYIKKMFNTPNDTDTYKLFPASSLQTDWGNYDTVIKAKKDLMK